MTVRRLALVLDKNEGPTGAYTWRFRHGVSDPVAPDAHISVSHAAMVQAQERDAVISAEHEPPSAFPDCPVCADQVRLQSKRVPPPRWRVVLRRILWGVQ